MSKVIDIDEVNREIDKALATKAKPEITTEVMFQPIPSQRKAKSLFFKRCPVIPDNRLDISLPLVREYVKDERVDLWWRVPGFVKWFISDESVASRLTDLMHLRLDAISEILEDESGLYSAKDKLSAGSELDKVAKTITDAKEAVEGSKSVENIEAKIKREYEKMKEDKKAAQGISKRAVITDISSR